jgi:pimeloyl-ACP methyl ester carboxylesterase
MHKSLLAITICACFCAHAQDSVTADPKHFKVEYEDAKVRVIREILPAGESTAKHSHGERITVAIRSAKLRIVEAGGKATEVEVKAGEAEHIDAQTHTVTNIGTTDFEEVSTEFKTASAAIAAGSSVSTNPPKTNVEQMVQHPAAGLPIPQAQAFPAQSQSRAAEPQQTESIATQLEERVTPTSPIKGAKTVNVNGQQLAYIEIGNGEPLVLVHDVGVDLRNWAQQIDQLAKQYRVMAYSRRYHYPNSGSGKEEDYTYKQNASDLLALIAQLNLGKVNAIGHGYGAAVVIEAAMEKPDAFRAVVAAEPLYDSLLPQVQADAARYSRNVILGMVRKEVLKRQNKEGAMRSFVDWYHGTGTWETLNPDAKQRFVENATGIAAFSAHPETLAMTCDDGKKLRVPTLFVQGEASAPNYRIVSSTLAECVPGAKRVSIPKSTHWMHRENPAEFNKAVLDFFAGAK